MTGGTPVLVREPVTDVEGAGGAGGPTRHARALEQARSHLVAGADEPELYARWFHGAPGGAAAVEFPTPSAYAAAALGPARSFEAGWTVLATDAGAPGAVVVRRPGGDGTDDLRQVAPPWYVPDTGAGCTPEVGDRVRVHPVTTATSGGFWHAWSAGWRRGGAPDHLLRLYLRAAPGAETAVAAAVLAAGPPDEVWYVKAATGPHAHARRDVAVLYLPATGPPGWVRDVLSATEGLRRDEVPPLTSPVGPGAALAADPGDGTSFGQAVCARLVALAAAEPELLTHPELWQHAAAAAVGPLLEVGP